jgi:hypothetical protein
MQLSLDGGERHVLRARLPALLLALFSVLFFLATGFLASRKALWSDEILTLAAAELPSVSDVWRALQDSADAMPPLTHVLTHLCERCFGTSHLTARLPAIVGFWLLCVSIFAFLRRRVSLPLATAGLLIPITMPAVYAYAFEARGYGLLVGFAGAAVLCWDLAGLPHRRAWVLPALSLCLAAAIASHLYGVLLLGPLAAAELARARERGRLDFGVWLAFAGAGLVVLPLTPFLQNMGSIGQMMSGTGLSPRAALSALETFLSTPVTYVGLLVILCLAKRQGAVPAAEDEGAGLQTSDWVLALALSSLPVWGYVLATASTGVFTGRYVLPSVAGFSILLPLLLHLRLRGDPVTPIRLAWWLGLAACLTVAEVKYDLPEVSNVRLGKGPDYLLKIEDQLPQDGLPIVVTQLHDFSRLRHYAQEPLRQRLRLFADSNDWVRTQAGRRPEQRDNGVVALADFIKANKAFYLYLPNAEPEPILPRLIHEGAAIGDVGLNEPGNVYPRPGFIFKVTFPG